MRHSNHTKKSRKERVMQLISNQMHWSSLIIVLFNLKQTVHKQHGLHRLHAKLECVLKHV